MELMNIVLHRFKLCSPVNIFNFGKFKTFSRWSGIHSLTCDGNHAQPSSFIQQRANFISSTCFHSNSCCRIVSSCNGFLQVYYLLCSLTIFPLSRGLKKKYKYADLTFNNFQVRFHHWFSVEGHSTRIHGWCSSHCLFATTERIARDSPLHNQDANSSCFDLGFRTKKWG